MVLWPPERHSWSRLLRDSASTASLYMSCIDYARISTLCLHPASFDDLHHRNDYFCAANIDLQGRIHLAQHSQSAGSSVSGCLTSASQNPHAGSQCAPDCSETILAVTAYVARDDLGALIRLYQQLATRSGRRSKASDRGNWQYRRPLPVDEAYGFGALQAHSAVICP